MNAKEIYYYFRIYQHFLIENKLEDDSETITAQDLIEYVDNHIDKEDFERLYSYCLEAY